MEAAGGYDRFLTTFLTGLRCSEHDRLQTIFLAGLRSHTGCRVLQSAARQEASQQRRLDKKKAEREKRDQLEPEALVRTHNPLLYLLYLAVSVG